MDHLSILLLCTATAFGGAENHSLSLYKKLVKNNYKVTMIVAKKSSLEKKLEKENLEYFAISPLKKHVLGISIEPNISELLKLCREKKITVIQCNEEREVKIAQKIIKKHPARIIFTRHVMDKLKKDTLKNVDTIVGVSKPIVTYLEKHTKKHKSKTKISQIPPLYSNKRFTKFKPTETKEEFFAKNFNLSLSQQPILCMIANLYPTKNHALLFHALQKLIYKKNKKAQLILAGKGPLRTSLKRLANNLKISQCVHFIGFTNKVPEILFYSDINILPSKQEGLGIALLEAGLMKKPSIAAHGSGMSDIIKHNKTGILFKNNSVNNLTDKIEQLIDDKIFAKKLGEQAYQFVKSNFSTKANFKKYVQIYTETNPFMPSITS